MSYSLPSELNYDTLSRMYPSVKTEYRKQPFNASSFTPNQMCQIMLNKMDRSFANPATFALNFNLEITYNIGSAVGGGTSSNSCAFLLGSAWSAWSRYVTSQPGVTMLDQIDGPGRLVNMITSMTLNPLEKVGMISMGYNEEDAYTNIGLKIPLAGAQNTNGLVVNRSFSIPLIGSLNTNKLIPLIAGDIQLDFTMAQQSEFLAHIKADNTSTITGVKINNVELVSEVLTLEEQGFQELLQMYPGVLSLKSQSYSYTSGQPLPAQAGPATIDQNVGFSLNSLKQFFWYTTPNGVWDGNLAGVNPNLQSWNLIIGSTSYPQQPVKVTSVGECYYQNSKSFGAFYSAGHSGSVTRESFAVASTVGGGAPSNGEYNAYNANANSATNPSDFELKSVSNKFYQCIDLETINQMKSSLYSGVSTRGNTNTLRLNIGKQLANVPHTLHMYACYDVVLNFDYVNGKISYNS